LKIVARLVHDIMEEGHEVATRVALQEVVELYVGVAFWAALSAFGTQTRRESVAYPLSTMRRGVARPWALRPWARPGRLMALVWPLA